MRITEKAWLRVGAVEGGLSALGMIASILYGWFHVDAASTEIHVRNVKGLILGLWILIPPIWFWAEYRFIYKNLDGSVKPEREQFKYGQDLSAKIWLAVVSLLAAFVLPQRHHRERLASRNWSLLLKEELSRAAESGEWNVTV